MKSTLKWSSSKVRDVLQFSAPFPEEDPEFGIQYRLQGDLICSLTSLDSYITASVERKSEIEIERQFRDLVHRFLSMLPEAHNQKISLRGSDIRVRADSKKQLTDLWSQSPFTEHDLQQVWDCKQKQNFSELSIVQMKSAYADILSTYIHSWISYEEIRRKARNNVTDIHPVESYTQQLGRHEITAASAGSVSSQKQFSFSNPDLSLAIPGRTTIHVSHPEHGESSRRIPISLLEVKLIDRHQRP
jgi:hypothetical protein